ncbi:transcriptional attenuator, LytR family [Lachnospiraceae bacterium A10]|nr:transcriptional attenuator, LytR family [Lachnospiraceae bacterium A10]
MLSGRGSLIRTVLTGVVCMADLALIVMLAIQLYKIPILPLKYGVAIFAILLVLLLVGAYLVLKSLKSKKIIIRIIGVLLLIISIAVSAVGNYYMFYSKNALENIANVTEESFTMGVYARADGKIDSIEDCGEAEFGILKTIDNDKTNAALEMIATDLSEDAAQIKTQQFDDVLATLTGLTDEEVEVALINEAYVEAITEIEGYETFADDIKLIKEYTITVETAQEEEEVYEPVEPGEPFLVYISGMDTWGHISVASRSDVNILAAVNPQTKQILLVSTPRDYYVPLSISGGAKDKLTHAGIYGIDVSEDTMEMLYDVDIDYYFKLNFSGFEGLIDAMGGITVWSDYDFTVDPIKHYVVGENQLTGLEALAFARERHAFAGGDRQRGTNQMNVIQSVIDKMCSKSLLKNYAGIMEECDGTFATDMTSDEIANLVAYQLGDGGSWDIQKYSVSGSGSTQSVYSLGTPVYVMIPNESDVAYGTELINKVLSGETVDLSATEGESE